MQVEVLARLPPSCSEPSAGCGVSLLGDAQGNEVRAAALNTGGRAPPRGALSPFLLGAGLPVSTSP